MAWAGAFLVTLVVELPVFVVGLRGAGWPWWRSALLGLVVNGLTHPALWFLAPWFSPYGLWLAVNEGVVWLVESALVLAALRASTARGPWLIKAGLTAFVANALSTTLGLLLP